MLSRVLDSASVRFGPAAGGMPRLLPAASWPSLAVIWFMSAVAIGVFRLEPIGTLSNVFLALPAALLFYWASEPLARLFEDWYGTDGTPAGGALGDCLPGGRELDHARDRLMEAFGIAGEPNHSTEALYEHAAAQVQRNSQARWFGVLALELLGRTCRGLVTASAFTAIFAFYLILFGGDFGTYLPFATLVSLFVMAVAFAVAAFFGFVYARWHNLVLAFRLAVDADD